MGYLTSSAEMQTVICYIKPSNVICQILDMSVTATKSYDSGDENQYGKSL